MPISVGDLVRVVRQPTLQPHVSLVGEVGWVEIVGVDAAYLHTLKIDGRMGGMGSVDLDCLEPCTDPEWEAAYYHERATFRDHENEILALNHLPTKPSLRVGRVKLLLGADPEELLKGTL